VDLNEISYSIRGAIFKVHNELGPGLLESVYEAALSYELQKAGLIVRTQVPFPLVYKEVELDLGFRIDILVEHQVVIEVKSIEAVKNIHKKQVLTYLKLSGLKLGILVNFNVETLVDKESLIRIMN
jgi:GxxExxY protein